MFWFCCGSTSANGNLEAPPLAEDGFLYIVARLPRKEAAEFFDAMAPQLVVAAQI
jgi:hypothetical protein